MSSRGSISFDRAADFYDKTRSLTPEAAAQVRDLLASELTDRAPALEVGVGTGRIALPLAAAGIELVGVDLSGKMLERLVSNAGGRAPFPIARADGTLLPFRDGSLGAAVASWVLHLIPPWREVAAEMVRVVRPGGVLLVDVGGRDQGAWTDMVWAFRDSAGVTNWPPGAQDYEEVDGTMAALGARPRSLEPIIENTEARISDSISLLEQGVFSVSFGLDQETRRRAAERTREWARSKFGDIDEKRRLEFVHTWRAYDL